MKELKQFKTLVDLLTFFNSEQVCRDYLANIRWAGKPTCPYCKHDHCFKFTNGKVFICGSCRKQFSVRVGTMFEDSKIPLTKWFAAIYLITSHKKGISSLQLHRDLGVTQKTAWFLNHRIRKSLGLNSPVKLTGVIEADETFIGGKEKNKHKSKRTKDTQGRSTAKKTPVLGMIERGGELRAQKATDTSSKSIQPFIITNAAFGASLNTDEWLGYNGLKGIYKHQYINHGGEEYVRGDVHTNTLEGYWSLFKRSVYGIYHSVSSKHLQAYVDESVFRYNTRGKSENGRFDYMLSNCNNHLTYKQLIQKNDTSSNISTDNRYMEGQQGAFSF